MNKVYNITAGLDIGNGYVKALMDVNRGPEEGVDFLSGVAYQTASHDILVPESESGSVIDDIFNEMEVSFDSKMIENQTKRLFGLRAISSGKSMDEFDVSTTLSKACQDLSGILVLGTLAGKALQAYWRDNKKLPTDIIKVSARISVALPITEYKQYRKVYAAKFKDTNHMISIYNFETPVRIEITIEDVQVLAEGASAQYAISYNKNPELFMQTMLDDLKRHGVEFPGVTAKDILAAKNTIGIDIGEGTANFPVFQDGRFNPDASMTFGKGYGTVLEQARERLVAMNMAFNSRKSLSEFISTQPSVLKKAMYNKVMGIVTEETVGYVTELINEFRKVMSRAGAYVEVLYVYGGGASPIKDIFYPALIEAVKSLGGEDVMFPVLYLDSRYSRFLNRHGLYIIARRLAEQADAENNKKTEVPAK